MKKRKKIPNFDSEDKEQLFWLEHNSDEYIDWSKAQLAKFPRLKPSTKTISLRLPENLLNEIKIEANREDVPYQSLMKILLQLGMQKIRHI